MLNTSEIANGGRLRARLHAMMSQPEKAVFDRLARGIGAFYLAVAALLIAVATVAAPSAETSATASLGSTSTHAASAAEAKLTKRN
jgi:hypothetical protein